MFDLESEYSALMLLILSPERPGCTLIQILRLRVDLKLYAWKNQS